jgi:subtilisin family serine protease
MSATALSDSPAVNIVERNQDVVLLANQLEQENIFDTTSQQLHLSAVGAPSWGLDRINQCMLPLDNITTQQDAQGVKVFVVDTGIYAENEEFANGAIGPADCHFSAFAGENALSDGHGHG